MTKDRYKEFEAAYDKAQTSLMTSPNSLSYEVSHCIEELDNFIVRIEWDSEEEHMKGFRTSPEFQPFFAAVRPFYSDIREMNHHEVTTIKSKKK